MLADFDLQQLVSAFIILFAVIDIIGSIPILINLREHGRSVNAMKATLISLALMLGFFYAGKYMLDLFHVDIASFAVAGALIIFLMSLEMILDVEIFKNNGPIKEATLVPLVFPLLAGAGSFTTLLSLRAEYHPVEYHPCSGVEYVLGIFRYICHGQDTALFRSRRYLYIT
jgi:multiple antibiotic resistance protein